MSSGEFLASQARQLENAAPLRHVHERSIDDPENRDILIVNPAHGNEPYILGAAIAEEIGEQYIATGLKPPVIIIPLLYEKGDRQLKILREETPDPEKAALLYYDEQFGKILKRTLFDNGNYIHHLQQVNTRYAEVDGLLKSRFGHADNIPPFTARGVATGESVVFDPRKIVGSIELASRVPINIPNKYFAFPEVLSRILFETLDNETLMRAGHLQEIESDILNLAAKMLGVEATYSQTFIPWVSTFSYQHADYLDDQPEVVNGNPRIYTPPMKHPMSESSDLTHPGIYTMLSGTGSALEANKLLVQSANAVGMQVYAPSWEQIPGALPASPATMRDKNIRLITGRSGWGTGWQAQQLTKPWVVTSYHVGDDPEIYFNNLTIPAVGLGAVIGEPGITAEELVRLPQELVPGLIRLNQLITDKFGTNDGIAYIGKIIFNHLKGIR